MCTFTQRGNSLPAQSIHVHQFETNAGKSHVLGSGGRGGPKSRTGKHSRGPYMPAGGGGGKGGPRLMKGTGGALGSTGISGGLTGGKGGGANPETTASLSGASD